MSTRSKNITAAMLITLALIATGMVYYPGLHGDFAFDDSPNILANTLLHIDTLNFATLRQAAFSMDSGGFNRPLSMLTIALNYYFFTNNTLAYKIVNLFIHLVNGVCLMVLGRLLLMAFARQRLLIATPIQITLISIAIGAAWLLHPLALTSVLYIIQRMNSLASLFTILGLIGYLAGRLRLEEGKGGFTIIVMSIALGGFLGTLCKENGLLLPVYALIIEAVVFQNSALRGGARRSIDGLFLILVIVPALIGSAYLATHPDWLIAQYSTRSFFLSERLLTEPRVLWLYLRWIAMPSTRDTGLFHDDIAVSHDLYDPASTLPALAGLITVALLAIVARRRMPLFSFAVLWFLIGQSMESSVVWLELAHEHRNYLPMYGILFSAGSTLFRIGADDRRKRWVTTGIFIALLAMYATVTGLRSYQWRNNTALYLTEVEHHPLSPRANYSAGRQFGILLKTGTAFNQAYFDRAHDYFAKAAQLDPQNAMPLFALLYLTHTNGKPFDTGDWHELRRRLDCAQDHTLTALDFRALTIWQEERSTHLSSEQVLTLFDDALSNSSLQGQDRAMIFSLLSGYYAQALHDYNDALMLAQKAIETSPDNAVFHVSMANLYLVLHNYTEARHHIDLAQTLDRVGRFHTDIESLKQRLVKQHEKRN